ncbi:aminomethyltransferase [Kytococcus aerolatus]|uniref:Aminomethyltransferase n=1 Tax=Kytococcus aerolatus TaxID=592308 RepID=A0A212T429_9MICO|nr:glycine cleavage system aminomethyltransferase GcvT [Kytococcus aerolatus]SNC60797.1 aminomethyltransferase [Kytococcus aerolatus]
MTDSALKHSPLHDRHTAAGAKMADFGGWDMPIEFPGGGVKAEHHATRQAVGLFDVSHMGKVRVTGPGAAELVNRCLTNDLSRIEPGRAQYTLCCAPDGGVVDDLIQYLRSDEEVFLVPNASNATEVATLLTEAAAQDAPGVTVVDEHTEHGIVAVQGPKADEVMGAVGLPTDHPDFMSFLDAEWKGHAVLVCRSGYTGEKGYEVVLPWGATGELWDALIAAAAEVGGLPAGLGARDTLRTEMGYPLHGHELSREITPVMARTAWAVGWEKETFWGKEALAEARAAKAGRLNRGIRVTGRGIPREGNEVKDTEGAVIGVVTSGTFSPTLGQGIAIALVDRSHTFGDEVVIDVRGREVPGELVKPPFVEVGVRS